MSDIAEDLLIQRNRLDLSYRLDHGSFLSRFFSELKEKRIWGVRCPSCKRVLTPPQGYCGKCHGMEMNEWIDQGDEGTLIGFEINYYPFMHPRTGKLVEVPWASGMVKLDGGANMWHYLVPADPEVLKAGDRYKAVWNDERTGDFHDILHFRKMEADEKPVIIEPKVTDGPPLIEYSHTNQKLIATYNRTPGKTITQFLKAIRDDNQIKGTKCAECGTVHAPPQSTCIKCYSPVRDWVDLSGEGIVKTFSIVNYDEPAQPYPGQKVYASIQLDGADTCLNHFIGEVRPEAVYIGMRVKPVFKQLPEGNILDIKYFAPIA